ncbi:MAG: transcriptional regulator [Crocinitomicaceae bacterium]|nr:transcriptional regulator [Crocinitomicaceae bacterium]
MTELEIKSLTKLYYAIGEVAEMFHVNTSLIRFWEKEFGFEPSKKNAKGNRLYTVKDIQNFNKIYHLVKEEGFTLEGAKKALKSAKTVPTGTNLGDVISKLEDIKSKLINLKAKG